MNGDSSRCPVSLRRTSQGPSSTTEVPRRFQSEHKPTNLAQVKLRFKTSQETLRSTCRGDVEIDTPDTSSDDFHDRDASPATWSSPTFPRHSSTDVSRDSGNGDATANVRKFIYEEVDSILGLPGGGGSSYESGALSIQHL